MNLNTASKLTKNEWMILGGFALLKILLHSISTLFFEYGFFRDELYYIACSDNLALGYVDQPPLSIFLLKLSSLLFGDSLIAIRILPSLAGAFTILFTGLLAKRMGGSTYAVFLSCLASFCSLIFVGMNSYYSMNSIDILIWVCVAYIMVRIVQERKSWLWIFLGIILGLGLLNKIGILFLGCGILAGLLLTSERHWLKTKWPYLTGGIAFLLFLPYIFWNINNDLAHIEFIRNASEEKYSSLTAFKFIIDQFLINNPLNFPLWIVGLLGFLFYKPLKPYRIFGFIYLTALFILAINGTSKAEYLAPAYPMLFAGGAVFFEKTLHSKVLYWLRFAYPLLIIATTLILLPLVLPILPVDHFISYSEKLGLKPESNEGKELSELPQFYADRFGWEEKARDVAKVYNSLSTEEKTKCAIFSNNYGRCGAIDYFGEKYELPKSIGNHNNYWIWGTRGYSGEIMIILGGSLEDHKPNFESVVLAGKSDCEFCMPYEDNVNIFLCRGINEPLKEIWPEEKHYE